MSWYDQIVSEWPFLAKLLPWVIGLGLLIVSLLRIRRGWQWLNIKMQKGFSFISPIFITYRNKTCHLLGICTLQDLQLVEKALQEITESTAQQNSNPPAQPTNLDVIRNNMCWSLTSGFWQHASVRDPGHVDDGVIDLIIQGPFCARCRTILYYVERQNYSQPQSRVVLQCRRTECNYRWAPDNATSNEYLKPLKRTIYRMLDAELRRTQTINPRSEPPLPTI